MENLAGAIETGWTWTGGSTSSKDTWSEIWGDGAAAAFKDGAAVVKEWLRLKIEINYDRGAFMLVITDGFDYSFSYPSFFNLFSSWSSVVGTNLVWICNVKFQKGTNTVSFLHSFESWNSSILNWVLLDLACPD